MGEGEGLVEDRLLTFRTVGTKVASETKTPCETLSSKGDRRGRFSAKLDPQTLLLPDSTDLCEGTRTGSDVVDGGDGPGSGTGPKSKGNP